MLLSNIHNISNRILEFSNILILEKYIKANSMFFSFIFIQIIIFDISIGYLNLYPYKLPTLYCIGVTMLNNQTDLKGIYKYFSNLVDEFYFF